MRNFALQNFPFLEDDFDALTDYELFCKMVEYMKKMSIQFDDFQKKLNNYENYFNNLNVQEEINNKLDEMYNNGELASLVSEFLALKSTYTYNTVAEMKLAENFVDGCYAKTLGYNELNDGGASYYYIRTKTEEDESDEVFLIDLFDENLVAELLVQNNEVNVKQSGLTGSADDDATDLLTILFASGYNLYFPKGTYNVESSLTLTSHLIYGDDNESIIKINSDENIELINATGLSNVMIKNIKFNLGELNDVLKSHINLFNTDVLQIYNCEFTGGYGSQLRLNGSSDVIIKNCYFHEIIGDDGNPGECVYCNGITNLVIDNCKCNNVMDHFLYLDGTNEVNNVCVNNCYLKYTGKNNNLTNGGSIAFYGDCSNVIIRNNIIEHCKNGIYSDVRSSSTPKKVYIYDNDINNSTQDGIYLTANYSSVNSNVINANGQDGLNIRNCNNINLSNNIIHDNSRNGISSRKCNYININNCELFNNYYVGITIGYDSISPCNNVYINSCQVYANDGTQNTGIQLLYGDNMQILSCQCYDNTVINYDTQRATVTNFVSQLNSDRQEIVNNLTYRDAIPSGGTYKRGDIILYTSPSAGGYIGAVCVTAGSPGTWKQFGNIAS